MTLLIFSHTVSGTEPATDVNSSHTSLETTEKYILFYFCFICAYVRHTLVASKVTNNVIYYRHH